MPDETLQSLLHHAAFASLPNMGWIRVTGEDRVRWLNGMATNSIATLALGEGNYNFFLNAQGRIQGDATAWRFADFLVLETTRDRVAALLAMLDRFIIMDDVELADWSNAGNALLLIAGPEAPAVLGILGLSSTAQLMHLETQTWRSYELEIAQKPGIVPTFEIFAPEQSIGVLMEALLAASVPQATPAALEQLRILEGTPRFGTDIRERDLPQETAPLGTQSRALHFSKGCYLGQEIVERIHSRGQVHRTFSGFRLEGELPPPGTTLALAEMPDKAVGELTSIVQVGPEKLALGYIRREALERGVPLLYPGGRATPVSLPHTTPAAW